MKKVHFKRTDLACSEDCSKVKIRHKTTIRIKSLQQFEIQTNYAIRGILVIVNKRMKIRDSIVVAVSVS